MSKLEKQLLGMLDKSIEEARESLMPTCCFKLFNHKPRSQKLTEFKLKVKLCSDDEEIIKAFVSRAGSHYNYRQGGSTKMLIQDMLLVAHGYNTKAITQFLINTPGVLAEIDAAYAAKVSQVPNYHHGQEIYRALMPLNLFRVIEAKKLLYSQITKRPKHDVGLKAFTPCKISAA